MIFTDKNGKIYEIPENRYAEFEVTAERAAQINESLKNISSNNDEVSGYLNSCAGNLCTMDGNTFRVTSKGGTVYSIKKNASQSGWVRMN